MITLQKGHSIENFFSSLFFSFFKIKIIKYKIKKNLFLAKQIATVLEFYNSVKSTTCVE